MFAVLLSDSFGVRCGLSTGPEIMFCWRFTEPSSGSATLRSNNVHPRVWKDSFCSIVKKTVLQMIIESSWILQHCSTYDWFRYTCIIAKTWHNASSMPDGKGHLLNENWIAVWGQRNSDKNLTAHELQVVQCFNRFVVCIESSIVACT